MDSLLQVRTPMESIVSLGFGTAKKRRSSTLRRPRPDKLQKLSPEGEEFSPNDTYSSKKIKTDANAFGKFDGFYGNGVSIKEEQKGSDLMRCNEAVLALSCLKSQSKGIESLERRSREQEASIVSTENKLTKVKIKLGGVTRTISARSDIDARNGSSSSKDFQAMDASHRQKVVPQDYSDDNPSLRVEANGVQGGTRKGCRGLNYSCTSMEQSQRKVSEQGFAASSEPLRKSKRMPKRQLLDATFDYSEDDDEIRYLQKLKSSKFGDDKEDGGKKQKISEVSKSTSSAYAEVEYGLSYNSRNPRSEKESNDTDYIEDEEPSSDDESESKRKEEKKAFFDSPTDGRSEPLMTRQRALQSGKNGNGSSLMEFPDGLPPAPPRRQNMKLSEEERQAKKVEAAQRRKLQVEKAARESEAMAIRKILGLDSDKKKAEKERMRAEKTKAANSATMSSTIRLVMGPNGTVVTFPEDVGLPSIFDSKPRSYPPPREKCAGPSCTSPYKYRDSKTNLPLCSLRCYRAVRGNARPVTRG